MATPISKLIAGYQAWFEQMYLDGRSIWLGILQLNHQGLSKTTTIDIVQQEVDRIYKTLLTNIFRNPRKITSFDLPILVACPDSPVSKHRSTTILADMLPNDGIHYHFILSVPTENRLKRPLNVHIQQEMPIYLGNYGRISKLDVLQFPKVIGERVADYLFKHIKRGTYNTDDVLILPARAERKSNSPAAVDLGPSAAELRAGFRHIIALCKPDLLRGNNIIVRSAGSVQTLLLSISMHARANQSVGFLPGALRASGVALKNLPAALCSATLQIPEVGCQMTATGTPEFVLRDLEAVFGMLVFRDRQFQTTPCFVKSPADWRPLPQAILSWQMSSST